MTPKENDKLKDLKKESWIRNVMRIYPSKTKEETSELFDKIFGVPKELIEGEQSQTRTN